MNPVTPLQNPRERLVRVLERLVEERGAPVVIVVGKGPECTSRVLVPWVYRNGVKLYFIQPGEPIQNCFVERFNGKLREECLDEHWFLGLEDARRTLEVWRRDCDGVRPHRSLGNVPPIDLAESAA